MPHRPGLEYARGCDAADPLAPFRERFYIPSDTIYLDGNSLGLASRDAEAAVLRALEEWKRLGVGGWLEADPPWFELGERLGALQAELVGAEPDEVVVTGSTTVNLHALVATFFQPAGRRTKILADELNFPSDLYALSSQLRLRGLDPAKYLVLAPSRDGRTLDESELVASMTDQVALVVLPAVLYRSGQLLDVERLARAARDRGITIGVDCSHSVGAVPHRLHEWGVDFAVWCTYKYLNGGPGALASLFVHRRHHGTSTGLAGWWGSDKTRQFDMAIAMSPAAAAGAWQIGTPSVLGAVALHGSLAIVYEAGIERIRAKSLDQTAYLMYLADHHLARHGFEVGTPRAANRRGGHVALEHAEAMRISSALRARGIVPDYRPPNVVRLAPVALYTTYEEIWRAVGAIESIVREREYERFSAERAAVA